jgi:hypothetical protein
LLLLHFGSAWSAPGSLTDRLVVQSSKRCAATIDEVTGHLLEGRQATTRFQPAASRGGPS